jgi:hypothetical protein
MQAEQSLDARWDDPDAYGGGLPPDWDARRRLVYQRDDYTCQECGRKSGPHARGDGIRLHAHHMIPRSEGGSNDLENITTLCEPCHDDAHDHDIFGDGWVGDGPQQGPVSWISAPAAISSVVGLCTGVVAMLAATVLGMLSGVSLLGAIFGYVGAATAIAALTYATPRKMWRFQTLLVVLFGLGVWFGRGEMGFEWAFVDVVSSAMLVTIFVVPWIALTVGILLKKI